jgi:dipeptidyl aminopeptidase/acylaminoacyl peptidase
MGWCLGAFDMSLRILLAAAFLIGGGIGAAQAAPFETYGRLPTLSHLSISPDGSKLAFVQSSDTKAAAIILDLASHAPLGRIDLGNEKLSDLSWADDGHLLLSTHTTARGGIVVEGSKHEYLLVQCYDLGSRTSRNLLADPRNVGMTMNAAFGDPVIRTVDGHTTVFLRGIYFPPRFKDTRTRAALYAADLATGVTRLIEGESANARRWLIDADGKVLAEADYDEVQRHWGLMLKRDGHWQEVYGVAADIDTPSLEGISPDGASIILRTPERDGLQSVSLASGKIESVQGPAQGLSALLDDPFTGRIVGGFRQAMRPEAVFFAPGEEALWRGIMAANPGADVEIVSRSRDRSRIILHVSGALEGDIFEMIDAKSRHADIIGAAYDGIGAKDYAQVRTISYSARDGRSISAYLTLPKGRAEKGLPLIVLPHGGPAARDEPGFDWWAQGLSSQGYAVLQPQFRGSDGLGWDLLSAGFGEWGRKMQTDLSDGVRHLTSQGIADPKRVCIVGASYGGYAALAGATMEPGIYRCAISVSGISDLRRLMVGNADPADATDRLNVRYLDRFLGADNPDDPLVRQLSPLTHAGDINIPVLLIHGRDDTVVPIAQSRLMADTLKEAGKQVQFIELTGEDHWLSRGETRLQMLEAAGKFLQANNPAN